MASTSEIEILYSALQNNVEFVRSYVVNGTIVSAVVKGNAYGHGVDVVIPALEQLGIDHFSVYSSPEAREVLKVKNKQSTIMIMGFLYAEDYDWILQNNIEFFVSDLEILYSSVSRAKVLNKKAIIHLDLETGMNRTGLSLKELKKACHFISENSDSIIVRGVTSHFAGAESIANHLRVKKQFSIFKRRIKQLNEHGVHPEIRHIASSASAISYPETKLDLVRVGILIYGYWPSEETLTYYIHKSKMKINPLKRAIVWKSQVFSIKSVCEGDFIGYGLSFQAQHNMKIMIVPVGYCNGYSRSLSNNGHVIVDEQRSPVIGTVNMNMIICDITNLQNVKIGDEVVLIGKQGDNEISFSSFARMNYSLNYEILARLPENIERKIVY